MTSQIINDLFNMQDKAYRDFHSRLIPSVDSNRIIGVRTPLLRKYANEIKNQKIAYDFLDNIPHYYYEENNLHAFLLEKIDNYDDCISRICDFLLYVDNWATCDSLNPKCFKSNIDKLQYDAFRWIDSGNTFMVRFGIVMLMKYFLDENFNDSILNKVSGVVNDEYYVYMAKAWFFAEALVKQYEKAVVFLENRKLSKDVHNKAIQKAVESCRILPDIKNYLKSLKY